MDVEHDMSTADSHMAEMSPQVDALLGASYIQRLNEQIQALAASTPWLGIRLDDLRQSVDGMIGAMRSDLLAIAESGSPTATLGKDVEKWRVATLGRSGVVTEALRGISALQANQRREAGRAANALKRELEAALAGHREALRAAVLASQAGEGALDVTLPGRRRRRGGLHPVTRTLRDILDAFAGMGFSVVEGPEVELDEYNFTRLRIPEDHPARDMWDTFWIDEEIGGARPLLLRTHTSPMQVRYMETHEPPLRIAVPGRCYRYEATDATHEWMMQQVELLAVDEGVSLADLKGTLLEFARRLFGGEREVMLRHSYFPFVEPGVEVAVDCFACPGGDPGCAVCRGSGWLEILGAGMVHPGILEDAGYDSARVTGFAAGMGVERIAMLRHGIADIRHFYANDLRFLRQFGGGVRA